MQVDIPKIKEAAGDSLVLVDEAHGSYCYFSDKMMCGALLGGADAAVTSIHKTLGAISGTAIINIHKNSKLD